MGRDASLELLQTTKATGSMSNLPTVIELHRAALNALTVLRGLSPHNRLTPLWAAMRRQEVKDQLAILDQYAAALPCPTEREAARHAAEEVRANRDRTPAG